MERFGGRPTQHIDTSNQPRFPDRATDATTDHQTLQTSEGQALSRCDVVVWRPTCS